MGVPVGSIVEASLSGKCFNQRILNVFHYAVTTQSSIADPIEETQEFLDSWTALGMGSFVANYLACLPDNYVGVEQVAQIIHPIRYARKSIYQIPNGTRDSTNMSNVQASITFRTQFSGRRYVGGKRMLMTDVDSVNGNISDSLRNALLAFCGNCIAPVTASAGGGVYAPVILHRDPQAATSTPITAAFPQDTTRVIRRRTVGVGE